jgi:PadR family transcriptional regulator, regulatory protein AphA
MRSMELSPTAHVILGMLSFGPKSGYEIKGLVDKSTRFFWAASYGQIYPELKRLHETGLVDATDAPQGERRRTVYELTDEGRGALHAWLASPPEVLEIRHEGMLKLFFAGDLEPAEQVRLVRELGAQHAAKLAALREIEPHAAQMPESFPYLVLRLGIGQTEWAVEWCETEADRLESRLPTAAGR